MPDTPKQIRVTRVFGFDPNDPHDRLILQTVSVYLRTNSQRLTEKEMHCSRSTVRKRLACFEREYNRHVGALLPPGEVARITDPPL